MTRGIVFLGTPHRGSFLADYLGGGLVRKLVQPSVEVEELKEVSANEYLFFFSIIMIFPFRSRIRPNWTS